MYGQTAEAPQPCPGEANCGRFLSASGKTRKQKEQNACKMCPQLSTKLDIGKGHRMRKAIVNNAMQIRRERVSGYPRPRNLMSYIDLQTVFMLDQVIDQEEMALKLRFNESVMRMTG